MEDNPANSYSDQWFRTFLCTYAPEHTEAEVAFLTRQLPLPSYRRVLDVCCGAGRHTLPLALRGYRVTGVDLNDKVLDQARGQGIDGAIFVRADMRDLASIPDEYDAVTCMWQSFGYFDAETNQAVLKGIRDKLRAEGRLVLDIYNRESLKQNGKRVIERQGMTIIEKRHLEGDRLVVDLDFGADKHDLFVWQTYTPGEISLLAKCVGLELTLICAWFDESRPVTPETGRMQVVFERSR